jgi:acyl carrier protein
MSDEVYQAIVRAAVTVLLVRPAQVTPEARLIDDLEATSLSLTELVIALEEDLGITVPESEMAGLSTVADIEAMVQRVR